jgi:hypothetical protein
MGQIERHFPRRIPDGIGIWIRRSLVRYLSKADAILRLGVSFIGENKIAQKPDRPQVRKVSDKEWAFQRSAFRRNFLILSS